MAAASPAPAPPAPVVTPASPETEAGPSPEPTADVQAVLSTLNQYAAALTDMNVGRAAEAWPTVDRQSLSSAFTSLEKNNVGFNACVVEIATGDAAVAMCRATVAYVPRVGGRAVRRSAQQWRFTMAKNGDDWQIQTATALAEQ